MTIRYDNFPKKKKTGAFLFLGILIFGVVSCSQQAKPTPTAIPSESPANTPTVTASLTPTNTHTPTWTPTATPNPTITPTPTLTPIIRSIPLEVDLSGPLHIERPQLSGFVRFVATAHFRIFYTMSGEDAVQVDDANGNALPDYVEEVAKALERS